VIDTATNTVSATITGFTKPIAFGILSSDRCCLLLSPGGAPLQRVEAQSRSHRNRLSPFTLCLVSQRTSVLLIR
jgi:regulator of extracellular matrix RemA (YlzA/DUF370 family)